MSSPISNKKFIFVTPTNRSRLKKRGETFSCFEEALATKKWVHTIRDNVIRETGKSFHKTGLGEKCYRNTGKTLLCGNFFNEKNISTLFPKMEEIHVLSVSYYSMHFGSHVNEIKWL